MESNKKIRALYDILGVGEFATKEEIKKAYRRLVKEHHPDKNDGAESDFFVELTEAYNVLMDDQKRDFYDKTGYVSDQGYNEHDKYEVGIEVLQTWFISILSDESKFDEDIINHVRAKIKVDAQQCTHRIKKMKKTVLKLEKVKKRIKYKKKGIDFLKKVLDVEIDKLKYHIQQQSYQIEITNLIINILGDYNYEIDPNDLINPEIKKENNGTLGNIFESAKEYFKEEKEKKEVK